MRINNLVSWTIIGIFLLGTGAFCRGGNIEEFSGDLNGIGKASCPWKIARNLSKGKPGTVRAQKGKDGVPGAKLSSVLRSWNIAAIQQQLSVEPGLYEVSVIAKGKGKLVTRFHGRERLQPLGNTWAKYSFLFEVERGSKEQLLTIGVYGYQWYIYTPMAEICSPQLSKATEKQLAIWQEWKDSYVKYGFYVGDPQPPTPGIKKAKPRPIRDLEAMTDRVLFWDDRIDNNRGHFLPRLTEWFNNNGIQVLNAEQLAEWMKGFLGDDNDAYGSVVCISKDMTPALITEIIDGKPLWERSGHHFESINIARIFPDLPGPQIVVDIDHRPKGESPLWVFDENGNRLGQIVSDYSRHHTPIDWNGDGLSEIVIARSEERR